MYILFVKASIKGMMGYRVDLIIGTFSQIVTQGLELLFIYIIFSVSGSIGGWNIYNILLTYGLINIAMGISDFIMDEVYSLGSKYLKQGLIDMILLRPVHPIISIAGNSRSLTSIGYIIAGIIAISISLINLTISINIGTVLFVAFITFVGGLLIAGITTIFGVTGFWCYASNEVMWPIFRMTRFSQYPINIYNDVIKVILTLVIPYALVTYYPSLLILGQSTGLICFIAPAVVVIIWLICFKVWSFALRFYKGTGS